MLIHNKNDVQNALRLNTLPDWEIEADARELVGWLQDMNWQVAPLIAERLAKNPSLAEVAINEALQSEDAMWVYWILESVLLSADSIPASTYRLLGEVWRKTTDPEIAQMCRTLIDSAPLTDEDQSNE